MKIGKPYEAIIKTMQTSQNQPSTSSLSSSSGASLLNWNLSHPTVAVPRVESFAAAKHWKGKQYNLLEQWKYHQEP